MLTTLLFASASSGSLVPLAVTIISLFVGLRVFIFTQSALLRNNTGGSTTPASIKQNQSFS